MTYKPKQCIVCSKEFTPYIPRHKYCSHECRTEFDRIQCKKYYAPWARNLSFLTVGAVAELIVCIDLMKKGFDVYRNLSPGGINDIIAYKKERYYGIDIKTIYKGTEKPKFRSPYAAFVVQKTNKIIYYPDFTK